MRKCARRASLRARGRTAGRNCALARIERCVDGHERGMPLHFCALRRAAERSTQGVRARGRAATARRGPRPSARSARDA
eukprot:1178290-Pyramimonas_sp.AAC.1